MKITAAISTYSRKTLLETMAHSLSLSDNIDKINIRVYDDASPHWGLEYLQKLFPSAKEIISFSNNVGPDLHMARMFDCFLETSDDILFFADSDLLFYPQWISFLNNHFRYSDGVLGLYHSNRHKEIFCSYNINNNKFFSKKHIGAAGVAIHKSVVEIITKQIKPQIAYDWRWSEYLVSQKIRLLVSQRSYVQHIGIQGANCKKTFLDFGYNFIPGNKYNTSLQKKLTKTIRNQSLPFRLIKRIFYAN